ncbi:MAG: hypothetical protein Q8N75_01580, partial [Pseudomonadota bacterium]|nr:hypothetical protein [Pseudomonadota bacterium]
MPRFARNDTAPRQASQTQQPKKRHTQHHEPHPGNRTHRRVIFLHAGSYAESLNLGSEHRHYLNFSYLSTALFATPARQHLDSNNIV